MLLHGIVCLSRTASLLPLLGEAAWGGDSPQAALHAQQRTGEPHTDCPVGTDQFGNRYFENLDATEEVPGRHRWVDYAQHDYNATQVPRGWSSWLHHIRLLPPPEDKVMEACKQPWQVPYHENLCVATCHGMRVREGERGVWFLRPKGRMEERWNEWSPPSRRQTSSLLPDLPFWLAFRLPESLPHCTRIAILWDIANISGLVLVAASSLTPPRPLRCPLGSPRSSPAHRRGYMHES